MNKTRILFVCTENSARSIIAEAIMRQLGGSSIEVFSAGMSPSEVSEDALDALHKLGIETQDLASKPLSCFAEQSFDYVITLCDKASRECKHHFNSTPHIVWDFPDPIESKAFTHIANELSERIRMLLLIIEKQNREKSEKSTILNAPSEFFKVLADPLRLSLVLALTEQQELCVCDFVEMTGMSQPKVSRHLAQLRDYALLTDRRDHRWVYYRINPAIPDWMRNVLVTTARHNPELVPSFIKEVKHGCV